MLYLTFASPNGYYPKIRNNKNLRTLVKLLKNFLTTSSIQFDTFLYLPTTVSVDNGWARKNKFRGRQICSLIVFISLITGSAIKFRSFLNWSYNLETFRLSFTSCLLLFSWQILVLMWTIHDQLKAACSDRCETRFQQSSNNVPTEFCICQNRLLWDRCWSLKGIQQNISHCNSALLHR